MPALAGVGSKVHWQLREIYEFWGYDWLMPLWDLGLTEFLSRFPLKHYLNRRLYKEYVRRLCNLLGFPLKTPEPPNCSSSNTRSQAQGRCSNSWASSWLLAAVTVQIFCSRTVAMEHLCISYRSYESEGFVEPAFFVILVQKRYRPVYVFVKVTEHEQTLNDTFVLCEPS